MKLYLATVPRPHEQETWESANYRQYVADTIRGPGWRRFSERHELTEDADAADAILILEPHYWKTRAYAERLLESEPIRRYPQKCFSLNYDDGPAPFFRGLYACLPRRYFDPRRHRSFCYPFGPPHKQCDALEGERFREPRWLFGYCGNPTHPVRKRMMELAPQWTARHKCFIESAAKFYAQTDMEYAAFVRELIDCQFVLCPRGMGVGSHRLFETMQMQRVPVVIADAWVEPAGPRWEECSIRIAEAEIERLPEILLRAQPRAKELAANARKT